MLKGVYITKVLSIFVDESGDFGPFANHAPFYLFTLVMHNQDVSISNDVKHLAGELVNLGMEASHCVHVGPLIRREEDYHYMGIDERRRILNKMVAFTKRLRIKYKTITIEKKMAHNDPMALTILLTKQLSRFLTDNLRYFQEFDRIIVYYDNGQVELNRILATVFSMILPDTEFKRVLPNQYRLFQVADLCCTIELIAAKEERHLLSKSESLFFGNSRDMKKNYFKPLFNLRF